MDEEKETKSKELVKTPVERAKELLGISGDIKSFEIFSKLREYRKNFHPDRFPDETQKSKAEEKFKEIQELLSDLSVSIQQEELSAPHGDVAPYKNQYDNVYYQQLLDQAQERIRKLESELKTEKDVNRQLQSQVETKIDNTLLEEMKEIENIYKISSKKYKPVGIVLLLTTSLAIMSKIEEVSLFIKKYAPISQSHIDICLFIICLFMVFLLGKQWIEHKLFSFMVSCYRSAKAATDFMRFLEDRYDEEAEKIEKFSEKDAFDYIASRTGKLKRILSFMGVRLYHTDTCENLKKCLINNLLHKKLIEIAEANNLDRSFKIIKTPRRRYRLYDDSF